MTFTLKEIAFCAKRTLLEKVKLCPHKTGAPGKRGDLGGLAVTAWYRAAGLHLLSVRVSKRIGVKEYVRKEKDREMELTAVL